MIRYIFEYDFIKQWRNKSILFSSFIIFFITGLSLYNGNNWIEFKRSTVEKIEHARETQYNAHKKDGAIYDTKHDTVGLDSPNSPFVIYWGLRGYAFQAPLPFSILSIGQSDLFPYYSMTIGVDKQALLVEEEIQNPLNLFIGKLDYLFFLVYLLPLIVIAVSFDLVSSEKESGTLRLITAQGISLNQFVLCKSISRIIWLMLVVVLSLILWLLYFEPEIFSISSIKNLILFISLILLYIVFWIASAYLINSFSNNSATNGIILVCCWVIFLFLIPTSINSLAETKYPVPSRNQQAIFARNIEKNIELNRDSILEIYLEEHPEHRKQYADTSGKVAWIEWYFGFLAYQVELDKHTSSNETYIREAVRNKQLFCDRFRFFSPALLLNHYTQHLAGTNVYHQLDYQENVEDFIERWRAFDRDKIFRLEKFSNEDFERLPKFSACNFYNKYAHMDLCGTVCSFILAILLIGGIGLRRYKHDHKA